VKLIPKKIIGVDLNVISCCNSVQNFFVTFVQRKPGKVYEERTKICKFLCVGIYMAIMRIVERQEFEYVKKNCKCGGREERCITFLFPDDLSSKA
jgi:hypothetical protein